MKEPRRLKSSGGVSQRLLDSASLDRPGVAARRHAASLAATASAFAHTSSASSGVKHSGHRRHPAKTLAIWMTIGAAASVTLGLAANKLLDTGSSHSAAAPLATLSAAQTPAVPAAAPDIAPEPFAQRAENPPPLAPAPQASSKANTPPPIEPWVPSPVAVAPEAPAPVASARPSAASFEEVREIEAARAAISRGDAPAAIAQLDDYDSSHPNGQLKPEAMALRIQALSNSGKAAEARSLANEFQGKYPAHPLVRQVKGGVSK